MAGVLLQALIAVVFVAEAWSSELCPSDGYFPSKEDCKAFYLCVEGQAQHKVCPSQMHWRMTGQGTGYCDTATTTPCRTSPAPAETIRDGPPKPFRCPVDKLGITKNGFFGSNTRCNQFYMCVDGAHYVFTCPPQMLWSDILGHCDSYARTACALNTAGSQSEETDQDLNEGDLPDTDDIDDDDDDDLVSAEKTKPPPSEKSEVVTSGAVAVTTEEGSGGESPDMTKPETDVRMIMQEEHLELVSQKPTKTGNHPKDTNTNKGSATRR